MNRHRPEGRPRNRLHLWHVAADTGTTIVLMAIVVMLMLIGALLSDTEDYAASCARGLYRDPITGQAAIVGRMLEGPDGEPRCV